MVVAEERLVTEGLGLKHLRLVFGTSMGGMHAWLWGEQYPALMDAIIPVACQPDKIADGTCFGAASSPRRYGPTLNGTAATISDRLRRWGTFIRSFD
jgi:pimeloyl-ACP methyl ester carboxylesterase